MATTPTSEQITHKPLVGSAIPLKQYLDELPTGGGGSTDLPFVTIMDFGATGNGVADDTAAVTLAEASTAARIYLPAGIYPYTGGPLYKYYHGEGQLKVNGQLVGQNYRNISVLTPNVSSPAGYGEGNISRADLEKVTLYGNRTSLDQYYFEARTTPHFVQFTNLAGHSGGSARIVATAPAGQAYVDVNAMSAELQPGVQVAIAPGIDTGGGAVSQERTILSISGNRVTFTVPLSSTVTVGADPVYLTVGKRTMNAYEYVGLDHKGGGDAYCWVGRVEVYNTVKQAGQTHNFRTATGGIIGGDMVGGNNGVYLTGWECSYSDQTFAGTWQTSTIASVNSFNRNKDEGTFGCVWIGNLMQSYGAAYCDAGYSMLGKWKSGFNTVGADFGAANAAIVLKGGHRIYFGGGIVADDHNVALWGQLPGDSYIGIDTVAGAMDHTVNGVSVAKYNNTDWFFQTGVNVTFNKDVKIKSNFKLYFDSDAGSPDTYLTDTGSFWKLHYNGQDKILVDNTNVYLGNTGVQVNLNQIVNLTGQSVTPTATTGGGGAAALPALPWNYLIIKIDGANYKIPVYNN